jgi:sugar O-acyltransferase (sialic acid O-acetyltransferase NeuD family)
MSEGRLGIVGAGGHGRVVADSALLAHWQAVSFFDDRYPGLGSMYDWPVIGQSRDIETRFDDFDGVIIGVGDNRIRSTLSHRLISLGANLVSIIHPRASVSSRCFLSRGCMISPNAVVNIGAHIGVASIVNTGATVDHDCQIGGGVHIAPGAHISGGVEIGDLSWIGVGATVRQGVKIGSGVMVGAGAVVVSDLPDGVTAVGCPARPRS